MKNWRKILAALGNDKCRIVYAELVLEDARQRRIVIPERKRLEALTQLIEAGLLTPGEKALPNGGIFLDLLRETDDRPRREGIHRFLIDGKIDRYPATRHERFELLTWIARNAFGPGENLSENEVNDRLKQYSDDYVILRRHLVDAALLERTRSGTSYFLVEGLAHPAGSEPGRAPGGTTHPKMDQ